MKLFEKPWLEILEIRASDIVTLSREPDDVVGEGNGEGYEDNNS